MEMHDFAARRNALFACLDDASNELKGTILDQTGSATALSRTNQGGLVMNYLQDEGVGNCGKKPFLKGSIQHLRGKESIFKKPELPITRCLRPKKLPDYQINPHKWKKYSLQDVDISDQTNSTAAFQFLREIDEQKDDVEQLTGATEPEGKKVKIEFKKSSKMQRNLRTLESREQFDVEVDSPKLKGSKLVMPEYVVGQKRISSKRNISANSKNNAEEKKERASGTLLLSHLHEDDEDDGDDRVNDDASQN